MFINITEKYYHFISFLGTYQKLSRSHLTSVNGLNLDTPASCGNQTFTPKIESSWTGIDRITHNYPQPFWQLQPKYDGKMM